MFFQPQTLKGVIMGRTVQPLVGSLNPFPEMVKPVQKFMERADPLKAAGNMIERWNPLPQIKMPTIPGPTAEQIAAQAAQTRLLTQQANAQKATEDAAAASDRARRARMAGRNSLLLDEVGIIAGTRPVQNNLGA